MTRLSDSRGLGAGEERDEKKFDRSLRHKFPTLSVTQRRNQDSCASLANEQRRVTRARAATKLVLIKLATAKLDNTRTGNRGTFLVCIFLCYFLSFAMFTTFSNFVLFFICQAVLAVFIRRSLQLKRYVVRNA